MGERSVSIAWYSLFYLESSVPFLQLVKNASVLTTMAMPIEITWREPQGGLGYRNRSNIQRNSWRR